ncbi:hypothetical protein Q7L73_10365 [Conexibacter sp. CPCC 205762]|nr:hypothetical protein [Conexibacter sp. CPCC 205762]
MAEASGTADDTWNRTCDGRTWRLRLPDERGGDARTRRPAADGPGAARLRMWLRAAGPAIGRVAPSVSRLGVEERLQRPSAIPRRRTRTAVRASRDSRGRLKRTALNNGSADPFPAAARSRHRPTSMLLGLLLAIVALAASGAMTAPAARAGTIDVGACEMASAVLNPADMWTGGLNWYLEPYFAFDIPATCAEAVDGVQLKTSGIGDIAWDGSARLEIVSPFPAATLSGVVGTWTTNPAIGPGWHLRAIAFNDSNVQPIVAGCNTQTECRAFSATDKSVSIPADTRRVAWEAHCYGSPCTVTSSQWLWRASRMTVTVNDPRAPVLVESSATGSPLTAPTRWLRGRQAISIRAEDVGGLGIEHTAVVVDGRTIPSTSDATCDHQWQAGRWCGERAVTTATIDTGLLAGGEHELTIEAVDASGNATQKRTTFRTDNHGDTPTTPSLSPNAWTTTNAFDLRWTNPGDGSPIVAAHITRCDANTTTCETDRVAGGDITAVLGRAVPAPGEWPTAIALEDEAGNIGPPVAAGSSRLASPPVATLAPGVTGSALEGERLTSDEGSWTGVPAPAIVERQWWICDRAGTGCTPLSDAVGDTVQLRPEHVGATFRVTVVARNAGGERAERSAPSDVVQARPPVLIAPPRTTAPAGRTLPPPPGAALRAAVAAGETLDVGGDAWDGTPNLTVGVQWQRCNDRGTGCVAIDGADDRTYISNRSDIGSAVRAEIVASNSGGNATAVTDPVLIIDDPQAREPADSEDPPTGEEIVALAALPPEGAAPVGPLAAGKRPAVASILSSTAPRARCVRELRVHLPAHGHLGVDGTLPGGARVLAGRRVVLQLQTRPDGVAVRDGRGALLGIARSRAPVTWLGQSPRRVTARAADGSALVVLGLDSGRGRAIVKGRTCRFSAAPTAHVVARADRSARWSAWLVDDAGAALPNAPITVRDGTRFTTTTTDRRGRVRIESNARRGTRVVTLTFAGNASHEPAKLDARLTIQGVATLVGHATDASVQLHGTMHGAARTLGVDYLASDMRWVRLATARVAADGRWRVRAATPRRHAGGPQLVLRTAVGAAGRFAARTGGDVRVDLRPGARR